MTDLRTVTTQALDILRAYPSLADDEQALADTLEGATDINEAIGAVLKSIITAEAQAKATREALKEVAADLTERATRFDDRAAKGRAAIMEVMTRLGTRKLPLPVATLSISAKPPSVVVTDPASIPPAYLRQADPKPDLTAIKAALKDGHTVPGAELSTPADTLTVRTR